MRPGRDKCKNRPAMTADTLLGMGFHVVQGQVQAIGFRLIRRILYKPDTLDALLHEDGGG